MLSGNEQQWHPVLSEPLADWHSEVEHIQTGRRWGFSTLGEMLDFLRRQAEDPEVLRSREE